MRASHSPHGECGLKYVAKVEADSVVVSLPAWGVRVEIIAFQAVCNPYKVTPRMGSAG